MFKDYFEKGLVQMNFEISKDGDFLVLLDNLLLYLATIPAKNFFPCLW